MVYFFRNGTHRRWTQVPEATGRMLLHMIAVAAGELDPIGEDGDEAFLPDAGGLVVARIEAAFTEIVWDEPESL
jgi:hypothetical protein